MTTIEQAITSALGGIRCSRIGVAVSGGSDSLGLLLAMQKVGEDKGFDVHAFTVDHGLRKEAADEATYVREICAQRHIPHDILTWTEGAEGTYSGNTQDEARKARYDLLTQAAQEHDIKAMAIGHTMDDQAETVLMRMGRSAGPKGLRGISKNFRRESVLFFRPILNCSREEVRNYLRDLSVEWVDDPSNDNEDYTRIKARNLLASGALQELGITAESLSAIASNMQNTEHALQRQTDDAAWRVIPEKHGASILNLSKYCDLPDEIRRRLILKAIHRITNYTYAPRQRSVDQVMQAILAGDKVTMSGCLFVPFMDKYKQGHYAICREPRAVLNQVKQNGLWDGRWAVPDDIMGTLEPLGMTSLKKLDFDTEKLPKEIFASMPAIKNLDKEVVWCPIKPAPSHIANKDNEAGFSI